MAKIIAPNKGYNGTAASVSFRNGIGETDKPHLIQWFKEHGYKVEETQAVEQEHLTGSNGMPEAESVDYDPEVFKNMDMEALKEYAQANGIDIGQARTESGIREKIKDALTKE
ncbi:MAG: lipase family protein [Alistipes sp.]|nr:lipase family protein [Alistipes sp.]